MALPVTDAPHNAPRVLMLGATGRVARMLRHPACRTAWDGIAPIAVSRQDAADCVTWAPGDDPAALPRVDVVLGLWGVAQGTDPDALQANVTLALEADRIARAVGARLVLHASSAAVYGADVQARFDEAAPLDRPVTPYGASKRAMEGALAERAAQAPGGPVSLWLRIANVAGADMLFRNLAAGRAMRLDRFAGGGGPQRSYIAPQDLARVIAALARLPDPPGGPLNVAAPGAVAMADLLDAAGTPFDWQPAPEAAAERVVLDCAALARLVDLGPAAADPAHLVARVRAVGALP